jgi:predicted nucleic acid-binding Zn ribbon protein
LAGGAVKRLAPRPLAEALKGVQRDAAPATLIAAVQAAWPSIAGETLNAAAQPVSASERVVTIGCESGVWAHELELLGPDLLDRLNGALDGTRIEKLRFVVGSPPNHR